MAKKVLVTIDVDASVTVSVDGAPGKECDALSRGIEQALGTTTKRTRTPDFYKHGTATIKTKR